MVTIPNPDHAIALHALRSALYPGNPFRNDNRWSSLKEYREALALAEGYIATEDFNNLTRAEETRQTQREVPQRADPQKGKKENKAGRGRNEDDTGSGPLAKGRMKYTNYTPLNTSMTTVYLATRDEPQWKRPPPMKREKKDGPFCEFHEQHGHATEECYALKNDLESLIRRGYFKQYVAWSNERKGDKGPSRPPRGESHDMGDKAEGKKKTIYMIYGGTDSVGGRRAHLRQLTHPNLYSIAQSEAIPDIPDMTFTKEDCTGVVFPHSDPLVVELEICNTNVRRILVDGGADVNVLYKSCFDQMEIDRRSLISSPSPIIGFTGDGIIPEGKIKLYVTARDEAGTRRTVEQEFLVVDIPSPYNAIVGRKFVEGIQGIHPLIIRQCYSSADQDLSAGSEGVRRLPDHAT